MQKAPVLKSSGLAPIDDGAVHVFGRNLEDRVVSRKEEEEEEGNKSEVVEEQKQEDVETIKKRKFETITGEEDEETVFQGEFKLFVWDLATSNWIEKGRGQLKLNDSLDTSGRKSRLIMRIGVINISKTSIRFTDSRSVWAASGNNARQLGDLIDERLDLAAEQAKREKKEEQVINDKKLEERTDEKCVEIEHRPADEPDVRSNEVESDEEEEADDDDHDDHEEEEEGQGGEDDEGKEEIEETQNNEDTRQKKVTGETRSADETAGIGDAEGEKSVDKVETKDDEEVASEGDDEETEENREQVDGESKRIKLS